MIMRIVELCHCLNAFAIADVESIGTLSFLKRGFLFDNDHFCLCHFEQLVPRFVTSAPDLEHLSRKSCADVPCFFIEC